jgi:predicted MPP superfamily phosphohydrolase
MFLADLPTWRCATGAKIPRATKGGLVTYCILHISDLHRSPDDPIGNAELISTLIADADRYTSERPAIRRPDAIVVSGDIILGVPLGVEGSANSLEDQYDIASQFLAELAERFLDGDRAKMVVVPGNHDVDWNTARQAMEPVSDPHILNALRANSFAPTSRLRWNWQERQAYQIVDYATYETRFEYYRNFVDKFYAGVQLTIPLNQNVYHQLFELDNGRLGIAAFNSCEGNDCFAFHGSIPESSLAQAHMELRDRSSQYDLLMAVWHHNVEGPPGADDYMDISVVQRLIGRGFGLALHGHQHRSQVTTRFIHLPEQEPMAVVSAGSLCAGSRELPTGVNRQYNVLEFSDDYSSVRVHIREMAIATVFAPSRRQEFGGKSFVDMDLRAPQGGSSRSTDARIAAIIFAAEAALARGTPSEAVGLLRPLPLRANSYARNLRLAALRQAEAWEELTTVFSQPQTAAELADIINAFVNLKRFNDARSTLRTWAEPLGLSASAFNDLSSYVEAKRSLA